MTKISLSFDDGRKDNYVAAKEILEPLNIPATFNITIGYVEKTPNIEKPSEHIPMSIDELKDLYNNNLFEIAGHGYEHNNDVDNLIKGVNELRKVLNISDKQKLGIVSPHSEFDTDTLPKVIKKLKDNNICYLRVGKNFPNNVFMRKAVRKINRKLNIPSIFSWSYKDSDIKNTDEFLLYSSGAIKDTKLKELKRLVSDAIKNDKSYIICFHSILKKDEPFYDDLFTWDYNDFLEFCKYLKKLRDDNKIEICKTIDLINK